MIWRRKGRGTTGLRCWVRRREERERQKRGGEEESERSEKKKKRRRGTHFFLPSQIKHFQQNETPAGYGYGLPISRLYARYFGGDLQIISMEGKKRKSFFLLFSSCLPGLLRYLF